MSEVKDQTITVNVRLKPEASVWFIWSIYFIWFIELVWFNQINETDQIDRTDQMNKIGWRTVSVSC
jgi:hypothetical protein